MELASKIFTLAKSSAFVFDTDLPVWYDGGMSHKRRGQLTAFAEWWKHLRKDWRRIYWKGERKAEKRDIEKRLKDGS